MIINTKSNVNLADGSNISKTITQSINVTITKCILPWQTQADEHHPQIGTNCHCLVKIYDFKTENRAVIIVSSLWSNNANRGIWAEPSSLAQAMIDKFPHLNQILSNCSFIAHSGQFSYPLSWSETFHHDHFREFSVAFDEHEQITVDELSILKPLEVKELVNHISLKPVVEDLKQLEHDNGWGGVVDDEQIKACWELENGIVLDRVRQTGLIGW